MTLDEFSNEFDVLYNNITNNQAPGLNEYEKSVFLTKAQDEIVKAYFNPKLNKPQEGYDDTERRQIDFSMLTQSVSYCNKIYLIQDASAASLYPKIDKSELTNYASSAYIEEGKEEDTDRGTIIGYTTIKLSSEEPHGSYLVVLETPFKSSVFDDRPESRYIPIPTDMLMSINEYVIVTRNNKQVRLQVLPIKYTQYGRLMSKPYKRPLKYHAWKLLNSTLAEPTDEWENPNIAGADIVVGPEDYIIQYTIRYIRRPNPIRLEGLDSDTTIEGGYAASQCELDPIIHHEIVQRAVELAKASYAGDLTSTLALGQASATNMGIIAQSSK